MNYKEIQELLKMINRSEITEFKIKEGDFSLTIKANRGQDNQVIVQQMQPAQTVQMPVSAPPAAVATPAAGERGLRSGYFCRRFGGAHRRTILFPIGWFR